MDAEFDQLYSLLGLTPACSPEELHTAFRRAVAELHPDRGRGRSDDREQAQLRDLIRLHARATEFHRRHGRLPGSNPDLRSARGLRPASSTQAARNSALRRWLIFLPLLGFVAWQLANMPY